jgi:hypothetical protein
LQGSQKAALRQQRGQTRNPKKPQKTHTLFHYINDLHEAFLFGIRTTFRPNTEFSSFLAARAFCLMSLFV